MPAAVTDDELDWLRSMFDLARGGETDQLAAAVEAGVPVNLTNDAGDSLLILAAYYNHPDTVRALLSHGADTARVNDRGQTALGAAVFRRGADSVGHLLAAGAEPGLGARSALDIATPSTCLRCLHYSPERAARRHRSQASRPSRWAPTSLM